MLKNILIIVSISLILVACNANSNTGGLANKPESSANNPNSPTGDESETKLPLRINLTTAKESIYIGESTQLDVIATYPDQTTKDITSDIHWVSTESNYSYSSDISGLLYGIHSGTKSIQVKYHNLTSNEIQLTIKPTLFAVIRDMQKILLITPYGVTSDQFPTGSDIYSLTLINNKLYACCTKASHSNLNVIGMIDLTHNTGDWSLFNNTPDLIENMSAKIDNLYTIDNKLVVRTSLSTNNKINHNYYWDINNKKWLEIANKGAPFISNLTKLYTTAIPTGFGGILNNIYSLDIADALSNSSKPWQLIVNSSTGAGCTGELHINNNYLYIIGRQPKNDNFCIASINTTESNSQWKKHEFYNIDEQSSLSISSVFINNILFISFKSTDIGTNMIYAIFKLNTMATPYAVDISLFDLASEQVKLASIGNELYAGANDGTVWSIDSNNIGGLWQKDSQLSQYSQGATTRIDLMYVAY